MTLFIKRLILFAAIPLLIVLTFDIYLRNINTLSSAKYDGLMVAKKDIEVIILGNSHAAYGVNPTYFKNFKTYNLANLNQQIYFDQRLLKKAIEEGVSNLKYVFISVDYHSLYTSTQEKRRNVWTYYSNGIKYKDQNYTKEIISPFLWGYTPKVSISLLKKAITRRLKYNTPTIDFDVEYGVNVEDSLVNGFIGRAGQYTKAFNENNYKVRAQYFIENDLNNERVEIADELKGFIAFLRKNNIEPILFSSPTYSEYNQFLGRKTMSRNEEELKNICSEFNLEYWSYSEDSTFTYTDFFDQDHLNKTGAAKFSSMLNSRLLDFDKARTRNNL